MLSNLISKLLEIFIHILALEAAINLWPESDSDPPTMT